MSKRTIVIIVLAAVLVLAGVLLAQFQRERKTRELLANLHSDDTGVAVDTVRELKKRGPSLEGRLILRLNSYERRVRARSALLLGEVGRPSRSGPALLPLLRDEFDPVRRAAANSLGLLGYQDAVLPLLEVVRDDKQDMDTRSIALRALSVVALKTNPDRPNRELCIQALAKILGHRPAIKNKDLQKVKQARQDAVQRRANAARTAAGSRVPQEKKAAEKPKPLPAPGALPEEPAPVDNEIELRADAALALSLLYTDSAVQPLIRSVNEVLEPSSTVRKSACLAIEDLRDLPRDDGLRALLGQALLRALDDSSPDVRMSAARALARHPVFGIEGLDSSTNDMLRYMAQDLTEYGEPGYWVRAAARTACEARHIALPQATAPVERQPGPREIATGST